MSSRIRTLLIGLLGLIAAVGTAAAVAPGQSATDFALPDIGGRPHKLSELRGKYVVLEWFNSECPFVQKHYESGNMQALQRQYTAKGVVWLAINSTNPAHSNFRDEARSAQIMRDWKMNPTALMLDKDGKVGQAYGARTTPHMFVIDPQGKLIYAGGIDDQPTFSPADVKSAKNYVASALEESMSGRPVSVASARPYGCSVKY
jgi:peroxiredoxin